MRRTIACRDGSVETVLSCAHPGDAVRTERAFREWGACVSFLSLYARPCGFGFVAWDGGSRAVCLASAAAAGPRLRSERRTGVRCSCLWTYIVHPHKLHLLRRGRGVARVEECTLNFSTQRLKP